MGIRLANAIKLLPLDSLKPYEKNARTHSTEQIAKIAASIREFGFTNPILVDAEQGIVAGHCRLEAARKLGLVEIPVVILDYLTPAQRKAYIIADNKLALDAGWDAELLQSELAELENLDFDLSAIGFSDEELSAILDAEDPEDVVATGPVPTLRSQVEEQAATYAAKREEKESEESGDGEDIYTKKTEAPIYTPKGEKPTVGELLDDTKTLALYGELKNATDLPDDIAVFLAAAAQRHTVFNYEKIAEYYAHAPADVQRLMEKSALVIIDFDKAIENGFVTMTKEIAEAYNIGDPE